MRRHVALFLVISFIVGFSTLSCTSVYNGDEIMENTGRKEIASKVSNEKSEQTDNSSVTTNAKVFLSGGTSLTKSGKISFKLAKNVSEIVDVKIFDSDSNEIAFTKEENEYSTGHKKLTIQLEQKPEEGIIYTIRLSVKNTGGMKITDVKEFSIKASEKKGKQQGNSSSTKNAKVFLSGGTSLTKSGKISFKLAKNVSEIVDVKIFDSDSNEIAFTKGENEYSTGHKKLTIQMEQKPEEGKVYKIQLLIKDSTGNEITSEKEFLLKKKK